MDILDGIQTYTGTIAGEYAAIYYADLVLKGTEVGGVKGAGLQVIGWTGGVLASCWTPDTALNTAMTLIPVGVGGALLTKGARIAQKTAMPGVKFFLNRQSFKSLSHSYWKVRGGAKGRSLDHWLFPQKSRLPNFIKNAGFNLVELPRYNPFHPTLGLNQWMGFAEYWGPKIPVTFLNFTKLSSHQRKALLARKGINAFIIGAPLAGFAIGGGVGINTMKKSKDWTHGKKIYYDYP